MRRRNFTSLQVEELLKERDRRLNEKICSECSIGVMEQHQELTDWRKCSLCGFCKEVKSDVVRGVLPTHCKF